MPEFKTQPISRTFESQRLRHHFVEWPNPGKPKLLMIHGGQDHCRNWDWVADRLSDRYHIYAHDLRGHGDSEWSPGADYSIPAYIYDLTELIDQHELAPLTLMGHSLGGSIALRYAGLYPDKVENLVIIEGLGLPRQMAAFSTDRSYAEKLREWIEDQRKLGARGPRRYTSLEDATARMMTENKHLRPDQAAHLTYHGVRRNSDGTYSWKFDNYVRSRIPVEPRLEDFNQLWAAIACPVLMFQGMNSTIPDPSGSEAVQYFRRLEFRRITGAGHWVHHDQLDAFLLEAEKFLAVG